VDASQPNPAVTYCQDIFPALAALADNFSDFMPILERVCRCWRYMILSYRTAMQPLLPELAMKLIAGFRETRQGCFLWTSDSILREFSADAEPPVDATTARSVFNFYEEQAKTFLRALNDVPPDDVPDLIEDFFRLAIDALIFYADRAILSPLMESVITAAFHSLSIAKEEPLTATLHYLRDFLAYGLEDSPTSSFDSSDKKNPPDVRQAVATLLSNNGEKMTRRLLAGMMENFPRDCIPDASGVVLDMFRLMPQETARWVEGTIALLPTGTISREEQERLIRNIDQRIQSGETGRIRALLQDFTNQYRRRNVNRREGLGATLPRFRYTG
jgi:transportin-3